MVSKRQSLGHIVRKISSMDDPGPGLGLDEADKKSLEKIDIIRLTKICVGLFLWLLSVYAIIVAVVQLCFNTGDLNSEDSYSFEKLDDPYKDIIEWTIPDTQQYYQSMSESDKLQLLPDTSTRIYSDNNILSSPSCIDTFFEKLNGGVAYSSPSYIKMILKSFGLSQSAVVSKHLAPLISSEQELAPLYKQSTKCLRTNMAMEKIACDANERIWPVNRDYLKFEVHSAVVLDALTDAMFKDISVASEVSKVLTERRTDLMVQQGKHADFSENKIEGVIHSINQLVRDTATNTQRYEMDKSLKINILEAVKLDIMNDNDDNAHVGIALAANVGFEPSYENQQVEWPLGKDWVDAYISWNLAFVTSLNISPAKLLIPSVVCAATRDDGRDFVQRRAYSLGLNFLRLLLLNDAAEGKFLDVIEPGVLSNIMGVYAKLASVDRDEITKAEGKANLDNVVLSNPSQDTVERMFHELCGNFCHGLDQWRGSRTFITDYIDNDDYPLYMAVIVWITIIFTGLGFELTVWVLFLKKGWNDNIEARWKVAQFIFPLFAMISLGLAAHQNYMSLLFLVTGLFKFGFPEILLHVYYAVYSDGGSKGRRLKDLINGLATILHHSSASLIISGFLTGALVPDRFLFDPIFLLVMQHWFVLLKYLNDFAYVIVEGVLEILFQWSVVSQMEAIIYLHPFIGYTGAAGMLVAHWLYWIAGFIGRFVVHEKVEEEKSHLLKNARRQSIQIARTLVVATPASSKREDDGVENAKADEEEKKYNSSDEESSVDDQFLTWLNDD